MRVRSAIGWLGRFLIALILVAVQAGWIAGTPEITGENGGLPRPYVGAVIDVVVLWTLVYVLARLKRRDPESWLACTFIFSLAPLVILLFAKRRARVP